MVSERCLFLRFLPRIGFLIRSQKWFKSVVRIGVVVVGVVVVVVVVAMAAAFLALEVHLEERAAARAAVEHMQADLAARMRQVNMCCDLARSRMASISVMSDVFAAVAAMGRLSEEVRVAVAELLPLNDCAR